jgi:hypothetical protein
MNSKPSDLFRQRIENVIFGRPSGIGRIQLAPCKETARPTFCRPDINVKWRQDVRLLARRREIMAIIQAQRRANALE